MSGPVAGPMEARLGRCLKCDEKVKVKPDRRATGCSGCGLTLVNAPGVEGLAPMVIPRVTREAAWEALLAERGLAGRPGGVTLRSARLLLVPFWRWCDASMQSVSRRGLVVSAADLLSAGLPSITRRRRRLAGLEVESLSRVGDAMGRLTPDEEAALDAEIVDVTEGPDGADPAETLAAGLRDGVGWSLLYYPIWSFRYLADGVQCLHTVDAATGHPVGTARRVRGGVPAMTIAAMVLSAFLAGRPVIGATAALPAFLIGVIAWFVAVRMLKRPR